MTDSKKWYDRIPHPVTMLFGIIILAALLSHILPAGVFERSIVDGRQRVIPGTFKYINSSPIGFLDLFVAMSKGFKSAADIIFVVFAGGIMFGILDKTKMVENAVGTLVKTIGVQHKYVIVFVMTFVFGMLGVAVGYEHNIAMVPIGALLALAIGGDLILAAGISIAAITVGFGLSPINPYTVGIGHKIAEMPIFSGALLRSVICFTALFVLATYNVRYLKKVERDPTKGLGEGLDASGLKLSKQISEYGMSLNNWIVAAAFLIGLGNMLFGIFRSNWYMQEISAVFLIIGLVAGILGRLSATEISESVLEAVSLVAPGAFMVGFATTIKVVLEMGQISDTIAFALAELLSKLPTYGAAVFMSLSQCLMNLLIPSGSGQALATLPVMLPVGDIVGLTGQSTILAFQIGDGVTNLVNPSLGGLIAMLSLCRVPFDRWLRFIAPVTIFILLTSWLFLLFSVAISWA